MTTILTLLALELALAGRCLTVVSGKPEVCQQLLGHHPPAQLAEAEKACRSARIDRRIVRWWSTSTRCAPPVVGTCRWEHAPAPGANAPRVIEARYHRPALDGSRDRCEAAGGAWIEPATPLAP